MFNTLEEALEWLQNSKEGMTAVHLRKILVLIIRRLSQ